MPFLNTFRVSEGILGGQKGEGRPKGIEESYEGLKWQGNGPLRAS